jgi:hypothetical protein
MNTIIKIRCGINWNADAPTFALAYTLLLCLVIMSQNQLQSIFFDRCQESTAHSLGIKRTKTGLGVYCDLPFQYCLSPIYRNASNDSEVCITKFQAILARIFPFISHFIQIIAVRHIFLLSGNHRRFIINVLWAICILIFIGITITIYWTNCFQVYMIYIELFIAASLGILTAILTVKANACQDSGFEDYSDHYSDDGPEDIAYSSERIHREKPLWNELV